MKPTREEAWAWYAANRRWRERGGENPTPLERTVYQRAITAFIAGKPFKCPIQHGALKDFWVTGYLDAKYGVSVMEKASRESRNALFS